jgi:hypothetical protein
MVDVMWRGVIRRALRLGGGMRHVILPGTVLASGMSLMVGADVIPLRMDGLSSPTDQPF